MSNMVSRFLQLSSVIKNFKALLLVVVLVLSLSIGVYFIKNPVFFEPKAEGTALILSVDGLNPQPISKLIWGRESAVYNSADEFYSRLESHGISKEMLSTQGIKLVRAGFRDWKNCNNCFEESYKIAQDLGAQLLWIVDTTSPDHLEGDYQDQPSLEYAIQNTAELVRTHKGKIKYMEIGNEPYLNVPHAWTGESYAQAAVKFAQAIKSEDPSIKVGLAGNAYEDDSSWNNALASVEDSKCGSVRCFDFIDIHYYPFESSADLGSLVANFQNKFPELQVGLSEWNIRCWEDEQGVGSDYQKASGGFFTAENLLSFAKNKALLGNFYQFFQSLDSTEDNCGLSDDTPGVWGKNAPDLAFTLTSVLAGGQFLNTEINTTEVSSYSGYSEDNRSLYIFVINRSDKPISNINLKLNNLNVSLRSTMVVKELFAEGLSDKTFEESETFLGVNSPFGIKPFSITRIRVDLNNLPSPNPSFTPGPSVNLNTVTRSSTRSSLLRSPFPITATFHNPFSGLTQKMPISRGIDSRDYPTGYNSAYSAPANQAPSYANPQNLISGGSHFYRLAESKEELERAPWQVYFQSSLNYKLKSNSPGLKQIWVQFKDVNGQQLPPENITVRLEDNRFDVTSAKCELSQANELKITLKGRNLGTSKGQMVASGKQFEIISWVDDQIAGRFSDPAFKDLKDSKIDFRIIKDGGGELTGFCFTSGLNLSIGSKAFCGEANKTILPDVKLTFINQAGQKSDETVAIESGGVIKNLKFKPKFGEIYTLAIKSANSLRRNFFVVFQEGTNFIKKADGTEVLLPFGDIAPEIRDGKINSIDQTELIKQWSILGTQATESGDLNRDQRVNSIDSACMKLGFNQEDEP